MTDATKDLSKSWIYRTFVQAPLKIEPDEKVHRHRMKVYFLAVMVYSILYGIYEYFIVYNYPALIATTALNEWINWSMMIGGMLIVSGLTTRFRIEYMVMAVFTMAMVEDITYFISLWIDSGAYPFPSGDWWSHFYSSYRVLGLGHPTTFPPYVPVHYWVGFPSVIVYFIASFKSAKWGRAAAWFIGPLFLAVLVGAVVKTDQMAWIVLIGIPMLCYIIVGVALGLNRRHSGTGPAQE